MVRGVWRVACGARVVRVWCACGARRMLRVSQRRVWYACQWRPTEAVVTDVDHLWRFVRKHEVNVIVPTQLHP